MLPSGARRILDARLAGKRPADPVVVSFMGRLPWDFEPVVYAGRGPHDWRWLRGLQAMVVVEPGAEVRADLEAIVAEAAPYVTLVEPERRRAASILSLRPVELWAMTPRHPGWQELFA
jgi:hypothetical protein